MGAALRLTVVVLLAAACSARTGQGAITIERFHSSSLGRTMEYRIFVPEGARDLPVVYLLHGYGGDAGNWFDHTRAADVARELGLVVVTPEGGNSWYVNGAERWEDYIVRDLVDEVERRWPVARRREARAIAGLSMGGYGAMTIAFRHPTRYAFAASMSGALDTTRPTSVFAPRGDEDNIRDIFGPPGSRTRVDNDVYRLAAEADPSALPYLHVDCGVDDVWVGVNREFAAILEARQIAHAFHELPGDHDFTYWNRQVRVVLELAKQRLK